MISDESGAGEEVCRELGGGGGGHVMSNSFIVYWYGAAMSSSDGSIDEIHCCVHCCFSYGTCTLLFLYIVSSCNVLLSWISYL